MSKIWTPPVRRNQNKHSFSNEARLARWFGEPMLRMLQETARDVHCLIPVVHAPSGDSLSVVDGHFIGAIRGGGFTSLSDLISEATQGGKRQDFLFTKVGTAAFAAAGSVDLWRVATLPASAGAAGALAAGTHNDNTTTGGLGQADPTGGDTLHLTTMLAQATVVPNLLMLYDRLWNALIAPSSLATQTCTLTGYPTSTGRYSGTGALGTHPASCGNFAFVSNPAGATMGAFAHTWTMVYTDDVGNAVNSAPAIAGNNANIVNAVDHAGWFIPLIAGDTGISDIESIACSVNTVTGAGQTIVLGHPLALVPQLVANQGVVLDGINSAFNLVELKTDCAPALLEVNKPAVGATTYTGQVTLVSG